MSHVNSNADTEHYSMVPMENIVEYSNIPTGYQNSLTHVEIQCRSAP